MKKILFGFLTFLIFISGMMMQISCNDDETYADQKKKERKTITSFIQNGTCVKEETTGDTLLYVPPIKVISEEQFAAQDSTTNLTTNEYVLLSKTGIYMQIIRKGTGSKLASGETVTILNRYVEYNISADSIQTRNDNLYYIAVPEEISCTNTSGTLTGSFISGVMKTYYSSSSVPAGWLIPLSYINLGRQMGPNDQIAKVRLIIPHSYGQSDAQSDVYACFYEISYEKGR